MQLDLVLVLLDQTNLVKRALVVQVLVMLEKVLLDLMPMAWEFEIFF